MTSAHEFMRSGGNGLRASLMGHGAAATIAPSSSTRYARRARMRLRSPVRRSYLVDSNGGQWPLGRRVDDWQVEDLGLESVQASLPVCGGRVASGFLLLLGEPGAAALAGRGESVSSESPPSSQVAVRSWLASKPTSSTAPSQSSSRFAPAARHIERCRRHRPRTRDPNRRPLLRARRRLRPHRNLGYS